MTTDELINGLYDIKNWHCDGNERLHTLVTEAIKALEQSRWIPVSEKLPSDCDCDWVLAQIQEDNGYLWIPKVMEYRKNIDDWYSGDEELGWLKDHNGAFKVVAWQPLPEPYKAESEETETWNGIHAQITAPKGTFERIFNNADDDNDI